ncbi:phasin family protein [Novosphingobium sediminicola]|uniref:Phasin family protein n=1 Tax=Novosphingobium sediminicola TaxID=563162 RepID=A0A7W6G702_9SPHN|nr:phasin family protein [Novosphingobium sediminicola]MBB3956319.1 phasin family protein [Novosphingobium sediminicola]
MSKKPTTKATFRTTRAPIAKPAASSITPETAVEAPAEASPAIEVAAVEPEIEVTPVAEQAAPVEEAPVAEEAPVEAAPEPVAETVAVEAPFEETPAVETEAKIEAPVAPIVAEEPVAKPVRKPAPRKVAAKPETVSPTSVPEVEAPTVEVSAQAPLPTETAAQPPRWPNIFAKEFAMSTFPSFDFAAPFQTAFADFQEKAKTAYEKGNSVFGDYSEFAKGNVEALVESSKILAAGLQELTSAYVSEGRAGFETLTAEVKELAAAKSPTDFLKLQNDLAKKHFDDAVAAASKHSEALVKLANEAAQPISTRVTLAVEKIKAAA